MSKKFLPHVDIFRICQNIEFYYSSSVKSIVISFNWKKNDAQNIDYRILQI